MAEITGWGIYGSHLLQHVFHQSGTIWAEINNLNICKMMNNLNMCKKCWGKIGNMGFPICSAFTCPSHMSLSQI